MLTPINSFQSVTDAVQQLAEHPAEAKLVAANKMQHIQWLDAALAAKQSSLDSDSTALKSIAGTACVAKHSDRCIWRYITTTYV